MSGVEHNGESLDRDRPPAVYRQRTDCLVLRASSLGNCPVALAYHALWMAGSDAIGVTIPGRPAGPPPQMLEEMKISASLEDQARDLFRDQQKTVAEPVEEGWTKLIFLDPQGEPPLRIAGLILSGTPDGVLQFGDRDVIQEIKCLGTRTFEQFVAILSEPEVTTIENCGSKLLAKYLWQLGAYNLLHHSRGTFSNMELLLAEKVNGQLTGRVATFLSHTDFTVPSSDEVMDRVNQIITTMLEVAAEPEGAHCAGTGDWCPWEHLHQRPLLIGGRRLELLDALKERSKMAEKEYRQLYDEIAAEVRDLGGKAEYNGTLLTWVESHVKEKQPREYDRKYLKITRPKKESNDASKED